MIKPTAVGTKDRAFEGNEEFFERFNAIRSLKTSRYSGITMNASYLLAMIRDILAERLKSGSEPDLPETDLEILTATPTEQEELRKSRIGQGRYRKALLKLRKRCHVTGIADHRFLRASHIRPWKDSNNAQRLDPHNGLLLIPNLDALFNDGFISFRDDGRIMISRRLPRQIRSTFGLDPDFKGPDLGKKTKWYLSYHRRTVFV